MVTIPISNGKIDNSIITSDLLAKSNALPTNLLNEKVKKPYNKYGSDNCIRYRSKWMSASIDIYIERDSFSNDELYEPNEKIHALLDNEVSQPEVNKSTADLCNLLYTSGKKAGLCKKFRQNQKVNRTKRHHNTHVNKCFTNSCEIARSIYLDLRNKLKLVPHTSNEHDLLLEKFERKFKEYKKVIRVAKRNYENEYHNKLRNMKSENCKDYWAVLNEHSPNDPDKFVINLEVFKKISKI